MDRREAIEAIKNNWPDSGFIRLREALESLIPELKESEDERIRKALVEYFKHVRYNGLDLKTTNVDEVLVWLEKQCEKRQYWKASEEQLEALDYAYNSCPDTERGNYYEGVLGTLIDDLYKLSKNQGEQEEPQVYETEDGEMIEPKFKVGDWITDGYLYNKITDVLEDRYIVDTKFAKRSAIPFKFEHYYHLWTIQDAKDGDVLVNGSNIFIFHYINDTRLMGYCHVNTDNREFYDDIGKNECFCLIDAVVTPATKEQRDLLFTKMREAGYEWDADKKESKMLEQQKCVNEEAEKEKYNYVSGQYLYCKGSFNEFMEGESYWFEYIGDDTYVGRSDNILNQKFHITPRQLYTWLDPRHPENSKEVVPMSYGKELDAKLRDACARYYSNGGDTLSLAGVFYAGVEAQKEIGQKSFEWSEEDENMLNNIINLIRGGAHYAYEEEIEWLKSLKPQNK